MSNKDIREDKLFQLDIATLEPIWGVTICVSRATIRRTQLILGLSEFEATWFAARRYADVELPESLDGMPDDLYVSKNIEPASQTVCVSITSTKKRKGMFVVSSGCAYPRIVVR